MRYVMRIAQSVSHQNFERNLHFLRGVCLLECLFLPTNFLKYQADTVWFILQRLQSELEGRFWMEIFICTDSPLPDSVSSHICQDVEPWRSGMWHDVTRRLWDKTVQVLERKSPSPITVAVLLCSLTPNSVRFSQQCKLNAAEVFVIL